MGLVKVGILFSVLVVGVYCRSYNEIIVGDVTRLYTEDSYNYDNFYLQLLHRNYIIFAVKACSDVHIALLDTNTNHTYHLIEVVIGGWENSQSAIRLGMQGPILATTTTQDILHCGEYRTFWIYWGDNIKVGKGPRYYGQQFMVAERKDDTMFPIHYVAFATGFGHTGVWEIAEGLAYHLMFRTPNITPEAFQYVDKSVERRQGFFTFRAVACHDLHIAMGPERHNWVYRVNFCAWSDTRMCVFYGGVPYCENRTGVCSCDSEREYWIAWKNNVIHAGEGALIHNGTLIEFTPPVWQEISYLSFSTGWGAYGYWIFNEDLENSWDIVSIKHADEPITFRNFVQTSKHHFVPFRLQACGNAWICFTKNGVCTYPDAYLLFIQVDGKTGISKGINGEVVTEKPMEGVLSCNMSRPFWVSYYNGHIHFGAGSTFMWGLYIDYLVPEQEGFKVQAIAFASTMDEGLWNIKKNHGDSLVIQTPPTHRWGGWVWMTTRSDVVAYFTIRGNQNAVVHMTETPGYPDNYAYEVVIGYENRLCMIYQKLGESETEVVRKDCPNVLNADEARTFWVSWLDGYIKLGAGYKYGQRLLVEAPERMPHVVNGISFTTDQAAGHDLTWEMEAEQGDYFYMRTDTNLLENNWVHIFSAERDNNEINRWMYFQVSGVSARLAISTNYMGNADDAYIIHIGADEGTKVELYKGGEKISEKTTPNVLHHDEMRTFWISWDDGKIQFGPSRYKGRDTYLSHDDGDFADSVEAVALAGLDQFVAHWRMGTRQGVREFSYQTNENEDNQQVWRSLMHRTDMAFSVKACKEVHLWFGSIMYSENWFDSYLIVLQDANDDSYISIPYRTEMGMNRKIEVRIPTPDLLSCDEHRIFWVSWMENELLIGKGAVRNTDILMSIHDFDALPIRAFSAHSYTARATFRFPMDTKEFQDLVPDEDDDSDAMSAGAIVGAVFGFLILTLLFGGAIFIILRPPDALKPYLEPPRAPAGGGGAVPPRQLAENEMRDRPAAKGFDNPLAGTEGNVEAGY